MTKEKKLTPKELAQALIDFYAEHSLVITNVKTATNKNGTVSICYDVELLE